MFRRARARRQRKWLRRGVAAGLAALGACAETSQRPPEAEPSEAADATPDAGGPSTGSGGADFGNPVALDGALWHPPARCSAGAQAFDGERVLSGQFARGVLYSWTSQRQEQELRADPVLLTRSAASNGDRTHLSQVIEALSRTGNPVAQVLSEARFLNGRYAWPNPWATIRGWPGESYGDRLLRIELRPEAYIVRLQQGAFHAVTVDGAQVDEDAVLENPERIGAVYFENRGEVGAVTCSTFAEGCGTSAYREYFVNNEQMVARWSLGTQAIHDELERSIALIGSMREFLADCSIPPVDSCQLSSAAVCSWGGSYVVPREVLSYLQSLALTSPYYEPTLDNMDALLTTLQQSLFDIAPLVHEP